MADDKKEPWRKGLAPTPVTLAVIFPQVAILLPSRAA